MKKADGIFTNLITAFVLHKQSLGYKYKSEAAELYRFSKFSEKFALTVPALTRELVQAWNSRQLNEGLRNQYRRVSMVRQFALHLHALGYEAYLAPHDRNIRTNPFVPYVFTDNEIQRIFAGCDRIRPHRRSNMHLVLPVILRLLYSSGLRISEAVGLQLKHINLQTGIIDIKNSKGAKDRMIPISDSLLDVFRRYFKIIHSKSSREDYFFMGIYRTAVATDTVYKRFREVLWECGISHGGKGHGPRIHDFRHTFAVHSLRQALTKKVDLYCALPVLSTYLGHTSIESTSHYVRLTAEVFPEIQIALDQHCAYVIPGVTL